MGGNLPTESNVLKFAGIFATAGGDVIAVDERGKSALSYLERGFEEAGLGPPSDAGDMHQLKALLHRLLAIKPSDKACGSNSGDLLCNAGAKSNVPLTVKQMKLIYSAFVEYGKRKGRLPADWEDLDARWMGHRLNLSSLKNPDASLQKPDISADAIRYAEAWLGPSPTGKNRIFATDSSHKTAWVYAPFYTGLQGQSAFLQSAPASLHYSKREVRQDRGPYMVLWSTGEIQAVPYDGVVWYDSAGEEGKILGFPGEVGLPKN